MRAALFALLMGCAADPMPSGLDPGETLPAPPMMHPPGVRLLEPASRCCRLALSDWTAFRAECGVPGFCVEFSCPLLGGGFLSPGVCEPEHDRDVGARAPTPEER